jgi:DNA adenine methylase
MFPAKTFWINDKYEALANFWQQIQINSDSVIEQVRQWQREYLNGKTLFYFLHDSKENFNEIEKAAAFFIFNRITFSGTTESGGFSLQAFEKRFTDSSIERLEKIPSALQNVKITNLDYETVVLDKGNNVFLFLDPPYFSTTKSALYGKNGNLHKGFDHERFAEVMKKCPHKWLLTYDDSTFIHKLFSFADITTWDLVYGMRNQTPVSNQKERF